MATTTGTFEIDLSPADPELDGQVGRFEFTKVWRGGIEGEGRGVMLSGGDPGTGAAGYVAIETIVGRLDGRAGSFDLAQFGQMSAAGVRLLYEVVSGSGTGELAGLAGTVELDTSHGDHRWTLEYTLG